MHGNKIQQMNPTNPNGNNSAARLLRGCLLRRFDQENWSVGCFGEPGLFLWTDFGSTGSGVLFSGNLPTRLSKCLHM